MEQFKTKHELPFFLDLKVKDIISVKKLTAYSDGRPVDIAEALESGQLNLIYGNIETFVNVLFVLCLEQIQERFNVEEYDKQNELTYQMFPEQKDETLLTKASRWFGGLFDGDSLIAGMEAFRRECVNFIPNVNRRQAFRLIHDKEAETVRLEAEYRMKTAEKFFQHTKEQLEANWHQIEERELQKLMQELGGLSG